MPPKLQPRVPATRRSARRSLLEERDVSESLPEILSEQMFHFQPNLGADASKDASAVKDDQMLALESADLITPVMTSTDDAVLSPRPQVQRLESLHRRNIPAVSRATVSKLKFQPKAFQRRSKEERDAQEKVEEERRLAKFPAGGFTSQTHPPIRGLSSRGGFRGGMSGWRQDRRGFGQATGPLSAPSNEIASQATSRGKLGRGVLGAQGAVGNPGFPQVDRPVAASNAINRIKKEPVGKDTLSNSAISKRGMKEAKDPRIKKEDSMAAYLSSGSDSDDIGLRINIEHIDLISDEDDEQTISTRGKESQRSVKPPAWTLRPIRLERHEHVERVVNTNTEASFLNSAQLRQKAKARVEAEGALFLAADDENTTLKTHIQRMKPKERYVQLVRKERKWKGVYKDDEDIEDEITAREETLVAVGTVSNDVPAAFNGIDVASNIENTARKLTTPKVGADRIDSIAISKGQIHKKQPLRRYKPVLQTVEDHEEWKRYEKDVVALQEELAPGLSISTSTAVVKDNNEDVEMADKSETIPSRRNGFVYLFQLPPILPNLIADNEAHEDDDIVDSNTNIVSVQAPRLQSKWSASPSLTQSRERLVKNEGGPSYASSKNFNSLMAENADDFTGVIGKLIVYKSGTTIVSWGGIEHEVVKGGVGEMLQEMVVSDLTPLNKEPAATNEDEQNERKASTSVGQIAGGFVLTPHWESLFQAKA